MFVQEFSRGRWGHKRPGSKKITEIYLYILRVKIFFCICICIFYFNSKGMETRPSRSLLNTRLRSHIWNNRNWALTPCWLIWWFVLLPVLGTTDRLLQRCLPLGVDTVQILCPPSPLGRTACPRGSSSGSVPWQCWTRTHQSWRHSQCYLLRHSTWWYPTGEQPGWHLVWDRCGPDQVLSQPGSISLGVPGG